MERRMQRGHVCPPMDLLHPSIMLSLLAEAPLRLEPLQADDRGHTAPSLPSVCPPLAPLEHIELPEPDSFGSTSPLTSVGRRDGGDGGMPRPMKRTTATVMPPFFLPLACTEMVAKAVWACVDPIPVPAPPGQIAVPAISRPTSPMELTEGAITALPCVERLPNILAAVHDLPRVCPRSNETSAKKPVRRPTPRPFPGAHRETGTKRRDDDNRNGKGVAGVVAMFGKGPALDCLGRIQEAIDDVPRGTFQLPGPLLTAPYVPTVPEPAPVAMLGAATALAGTECPRLVAGLDGAASTALQALGAGFSESCVVAAKPPQPIDRRSVVQPRFGCYQVTSASRAPTGMSGRAPHLPREHNDTLEEEVPVWRDSSNGPGASLPPPGPVWRDSDELLAELRASSTHALSAVSRRRGHRDNLRQLPQKKLTKNRQKILRGKEDVSSRTGTTPGRKQRTVVWKDVATVPRRVLFGPTRLSDILLDVEVTPSKPPSLAEAFRKQPELWPSDGVVGATSIPPPPPPEKIPKTIQPWRQNTQPVLARRIAGEGRRAQSPTNLRPIAVKSTVGLPRLKSRSTENMNGNGRFLSATTSSSSTSSFWKSIACIPEDSPLPRGHRVSAGKHPHPPGYSGNARRWRRRQRFSGKRRSTAVGDVLRTTLGPPRAPAFEPREDFMDHHWPGQQPALHGDDVKGGRDSHRKAGSTNRK